MPSMRLRMRGARITHCVIALAVAAVAVLAIPQLAQAAAKFEAETMTGGKTVTSSSASGGAYLALNHTASASKNVSVATSVARVVIRARGQQCGGAPKMAVSLDGTRRTTVDVTATSWTDYAAAVNAPSGSHTVKVDFTNDYSSSSCDRNLYADVVTLEAPATTTPTPPAPTDPTPAPTDPVPACTLYASPSGSSGASGLSASTPT